MFISFAYKFLKSISFSFILYLFPYRFDIHIHTMDGCFYLLVIVRHFIEKESGIGVSKFAFILSLR